MIESDWKKPFLISLIGSLCISAFIGVIIFLIGNFGELEMRILGTTISIGIFSLIGLFFANLCEKNKVLLFSSTGLIFTILGFLINVLFIWDLLDDEIYWKSMLIFIIITLSALHAALIMLLKSNNLVNTSIMATLLMIGLVAIFLISLVILDGDVSAFVFRILGAIAILDGLGTIVTPLLKRFTKLE